MELKENDLVNNPVESQEAQENKEVNKLNTPEEIDTVEKQENIDAKITSISKEETSLIEKPEQAFVPVQEPPKKKSILSIFSILVGILVIIILTSVLIFTGYNIFNQNIVSGVSVKGIDISNMSKSDAKYKLDNQLAEILPEEIKVKHGDFEATLSTSQIGVEFDTKTATNQAFNIARQGNIFENDFHVLSTMFSKTDINLNLKLDTEQISKNLEEMSAQLPDKVTDSSYYIDGNDLIVTPGKTGNVVDVDASIKNIKTAILTLSNLDQPIELAVKTQEPEKINIENIHNEIYKEPKDAYYTQNPFTVYPSENGLDFKISIEEANNILGDQSADEYTIPLKVLYPNVTTNMIGSEAFPDLLSSFSTKYSVGATARTTNLRLAASKINGTVLMPGETFSYNKVVGARTIAAGYKEAPIYVSGEVVDGLGGGICQITSTLYNAVVYANLEIVERTNHQFVPSYANASRDATVVYGAIDFKFKNNRDYPIKITCSVSNGIANFKIFGLKSENDYDVQITSRITRTTSNAIYSEAYKTLKKNGNVISTEIISKDTYKRH